MQAPRGSGTGRSRALHRVVLPWSACPGPLRALGSIRNIRIEGLFPLFHPLHYLLQPPAETVQTNPAFAAKPRQPRAPSCKPPLGKHHYGIFIFRRSGARSPLQAGTRLSWCSCLRTDPQVPGLLLGLFQMT